jgi:hypothetical protein
MQYTLGLNGNAYYNSGSYASPVWVLIPSVGDLDNAFEWDEADASSRAGEGEEWSMPALSKKTVDFDLKYDPTDTAWTYLQTASVARSAVEFLILDGLEATTGTQGPRVTCSIFKFGRTEKLKEVMGTPISLKPCPAAHPFAWFTTPS